MNYTLYYLKVTCQFVTVLFICSHEDFLGNVTIFMKCTNPDGCSYLVSALGGLQLIGMVEVESLSH